MTRRAGRRIRSKTARTMLSFRHYEFGPRWLNAVTISAMVGLQFQWSVMAWQRGAVVLDVNEAYTSKTCSWDGSIKSNLGGRRPEVPVSSGTEMVSGWIET